MKSNRREILFRSRLGARAGCERLLSDPESELFLHVRQAPTAQPAVDTASWMRLTSFLEQAAATGRVVAGFLGYELLHALEAVPTVPRRDLPGDRLPDLHLFAFRREEQRALPAPSAAHAATPHPENFTADFSRAEYEDRIVSAREAILEGELFEVCFTQSLVVPCRHSADELFARLALRSPAACATLFETGAAAVVSNSPELLLQVTGQTLESRPIKGTCRRGADPEVDRRLAAGLLTSSKDRAELAMIVDVTRNDLGRVAVPGGVVVEDEARLHTVSRVHHLEAVVSAHARAGLTAIQALAAIFPGGSVTGAPKVRAMEEIARLEVTRRGPYCGALVVFEPSGDAHCSVAIRTGVLQDGLLHLHSGGAVTADSDAAHEYEEMLSKAGAMLAAAAG